MSRPEKFIKTCDELLGELLRSEKDLSRSSLMFRSVIASAFGLNVTDAECVDYLMDFRASHGWQAGRTDRADPRRHY